MRSGSAGGVAGFGPFESVAAVMAAITTPTMTTTTGTELTRTPSLPARPATPGTPLDDGRRLQLWIALTASGLLVALVVLALLVPVPYLSLEPGSARPVADLVHVAGADSYPPEGSVAFTTVSQREATLAEALRGWIDDDIEVVPRKAVLGDQTADENRRYNAELMGSSKFAAITVALRRLGYTWDIQTSGSVVRRIEPDSPAAGALQLDDVIVAVDGEAVNRIGELRDLLQVGGPKAAHILAVERPAGSATRIDVPISTTELPEDPTRAVIGIAPEERIVDFDFPVDVTIDLDDVGGPSAGLAFTLAILDVLTPGELTGGHKVAVTGTIDIDGNVGPVGGGVQKAVAVRNAGYEAFLVPSDEYEMVQDKVGGDLQVIAVDTLAQALDALASLGGDVASLGPAEAPSAR